MQKELILVMDFRYDEGARPRKEKICPCINSGTCGRGGNTYQVICRYWWRNGQDQNQTSN